MADLSTNYLGLKLKNPIIAGSCGLTNSVDSIKKLADNGIAAIVLKSLFEEQILFNANEKTHENQYDYPEAYDYIKNYSKLNDIATYLNLISQTKYETQIPIIASINCVSPNEWVTFAKDIENAGADALELNIMILSSNAKYSSQDNEQMMLDIIQKVRQNTKLPIAVKLSSHSSGLAHFIQKLDWSKLIQAIVLFNRQYSPDIDIETLKITSANVLSNPTDYVESLRWVAIMSDKIKMDIAATTGIWESKTIIKQLLAGADAVQIASVLYKNGPVYIQTLINELDSWMKQKGFNSINDFKGKMSMQNTQSPVAFERIQFMRYFSNIE
ncbi:MAG: dihydroorotate dehydrogenase-like protein [Bacteroidales bacterium]|nr:dihydroorotate dehydrogenase-like protein [Bacteroidales bacterium]